jgi:hypothetical protein
MAAAFLVMDMRKVYLRLRSGYDNGMKKQTVIALPAPFFGMQLLGIALLLPGLLSTGSGLAQTSGQTSGQMPAHEAAQKPKVRSTALSVTVNGKTQTFSTEEIAALPHETVNMRNAPASVMNGHLKQTWSYSGVPLAALLEKMGLPFEKANEHALLQSYWIAEGTDGYRVVVSAYEALPTVHMDSVLVADSGDGKPLAADGALKLVISGDKRPQRWVQNLKSLTLKLAE